MSVARVEALITIGISGFGVTGGVHRYWTHRTYKAKLPLQIILLASYHVAGQVSALARHREVADSLLTHSCHSNISPIQNVLIINYLLLFNLAMGVILYFIRLKW